MDNVEDRDKDNRSKAKDNNHDDKPRRSKLVAWKRSKVKNLDRQGRWDELEGD